MRDFRVRLWSDIAFWSEYWASKVACRLCGHRTRTRRTLSGKTLTICTRLACRGRLL